MKNISSLIIASILVIVVCLFLSSCYGEKRVYEITLLDGGTTNVEYVNCHQVTNDGMFDKDESPYMTIECHNGDGKDLFTIVAVGLREKK